MDWRSHHSARLPQRCYPIVCEAGTCVIKSIEFQVSALIACTYAQGQHKASVEKKRAVNQAMQDALGDNSLIELSSTFAIVESSDEENPDMDEM